MPIYEYKCGKCGKSFEVIEQVTESGTHRCESCGSLAQRVISSSSFQLKGGGWYSEGYSSNQCGVSESCAGCSKAGN